MQGHRLPARSTSEEPTHAGPHRHQHLPLQAPTVMAKAGRPFAFSMPPLERAFILGNELLAASEQISNAEGWRSFVAQSGLSARSVRRHVAFARWANEYPEDFAVLVHMRNQPSLWECNNWE